MTEERSRAAHHVEDLSVLSRRGALSTADKQAFADALEASATLATAHQLGLDFDQIAIVQPGDDALIAEIAARSGSRAQPRAGARFRTRALLLAAALACAGSATAWWQRSRTAPVAQPLATAKPAASAATPAKAPARLNQAPAVPPTTDAVPELEALHQDEPRRVAAPPSVTNNTTERTPGARGEQPSARSFDSAEALFREASAARRSGDLVSARVLYLRLERDFPASDEAHLAHVSLGNLLLSMGRAAEAEQQFASYLGGRPALAQEALVGRAQSLAALGRRSDERRVWEGLLHDYPTSVYAARARQRLAELAVGPSLHE